MSYDDGLDWLHPYLDRCRHLIARRGTPRQWTKPSSRETAETVTQLDVEIERLLVGAIHRRDSTAGIISEESNPDSSALSQPYCLVIDPIDGTDELVGGRSGFAISIALFRRGEPTAAIVDMPALNRRFQCGPGKPTMLNGQVVRLHDIDDIHRARLAVSATQYRHESLRTFWRQLGAAALLPTPAFAAKFGAVLSGDCDAAIYLDVHPLRTALWDYAAPALLLARAGAGFWSLDGVDLLRSRPWAHQAGWIASPPRLRAELLRVAHTVPT